MMAMTMNFKLANQLTTDNFEIGDTITDLENPEELPDDISIHIDTEE